jgi:hypothetical protein
MILHEGRLLQRGLSARMRVAAEFAGRRLRRDQAAVDADDLPVERMAAMHQLARDRR